ncbi:MAG TPA: SIMPL domain-containing protein [Candidatus Saccharimonadales bacterium]|nr:SIMPL domain-containing protein [Candidatus Saccharimonadales bacterium]
MEPSTNNKQSPRLRLALDYRIICIVLVLIVVGLVLLWRPWHHATNTSRTISVTGDATLTAEPDEFVFSPSYRLTETDPQTALSDLSKKSDAIVAQLKTLGVPNNKIKTNADSWSYPVYYSDTSSQEYTLQLTVTVNNLALSQKVEDYLLTTSPSGEITPSADFSTSKQKSLQNQARDEATKDARAKAEQSAKNLGFKLGAVKTVDDSAGFDGGIAYPLAAGSNLTDSASSKSSLTVQPGENDLSYSVTVTYYIR